MSSRDGSQSEQGLSRHAEIDQELADAEEDLANVQEELAELEQQMGMAADADSLNIRAAEEKRRAKKHLQDKILTLKQRRSALDQARPPR